MADARKGSAVLVSPDRTLDAHETPRTPSRFHEPGRPTLAMTPTADRTIRVGHSPDSDDAFMFYALAQEKLDTGGLRFVHQLEDIETLNHRALSGELEVSAV